MDRHFDTTSSFRLSEGFGLNLSHELHGEGINCRHLGLLRSMFWRPSSCLVSVYSHMSTIKTTQDLRQEVRSGDQIFVGGKLFDVDDKRAISASQIPVKQEFDGQSQNGLIALIGRVGSPQSQRHVDNSRDLRLVLLAEASDLFNIIFCSWSFVFTINGNILLSTVTNLNIFVLHW